MSVDKLLNPQKAITKAQKGARRKAQFEETLARGRTNAEKRKFEQESSVKGLLRKRQTSRAGIPKEEELLGGEPFSLALDRLRG
jgi:hypothetical protein